MGTRCGEGLLGTPKGTVAVLAEAARVPRPGTGRGRLLLGGPGASGAVGRGQPATGVLGGTEGESRPWGPAPREGVSGTHTRSQNWEGSLAMSWIAELRGSGGRAERGITHSAAAAREAPEPEPDRPSGASCSGHRQGSRPESRLLPQPAGPPVTRVCPLSAPRHAASHASPAGLVHAASPGHSHRHGRHRPPSVPQP